MDCTTHDLTKEQGVRELAEIQPLAEAVTDCVTLDGQLSSSWITGRDRACTRTLRMKKDGETQEVLVVNCQDFVTGWIWKRIKEATP